MTRTTRMLRLSIATATVGLTVAATAASAATPPRPGCGYGDTNHAHQAAPGLDPLDFRPGWGYGDTVHAMHTAAPGQAPDDGGDQSGPMRGCKER